MNIEIIAEFCQNHNGDYGLLREMIAAAQEGGATHGKIQTIFSDNLAFRPEFEEGLVLDGKTLIIKRPYMPEYERLRALELSFAQMEEFAKACSDVGLTPLTTCFAREHVKEIAAIGFDQIKVASYDCASFPLIEELAENFDHLYISTGATYPDEVEYTSHLLSGTNFSFLHCVTIYPTPLNLLCLDRMNYLKQFTSAVGFSDHTLIATDGIVASKIALTLGATIIERHFTILPPEQTKDGPVSIKPNHLKEIVEFSKLPKDVQADKLDQAIPDWRQCIGTFSETLSEQELLNRDYYRGRFGSRRAQPSAGKNMIFNWNPVALPCQSN